MVAVTASGPTSPGRRRLERQRLQVLAPRGLRGRGRDRQPRRDAPLRPPALLRVPPDAEGRSVVEVVEQLGHAPTMTLDVYGHVLGELAGQPRRSAEDLIRDARANVRAESVRATFAHKSGG
jgi:hypothetical protein